MVNCSAVDANAPPSTGSWMKSTPNLSAWLPHNVAQVVAKLVFVLIAQVGEKSDGSGELVVAKSFEAGDGQRRHAERKLAARSPDPNYASG